MMHTRDLRHFEVTQLHGPAARNKGMALFPRYVGGRKLALCRSLLPARPTVAEPNIETGEPEPRLCPICKVGWLVSIEILPAGAIACVPAPMTADTS